MTNPAAQDLIADLAVQVANRLPPSEVSNIVLQAVIHDPALQIAVGYGHRPRDRRAVWKERPGWAVGGVVGVTATLFVGVAAGFAALFGGAAAVSGSAASTYSSVQVATGSVLLAMSVVREAQDSLLVRPPEGLPQRRACRLQGRRCTSRTRPWWRSGFSSISCSPLGVQAPVGEALAAPA